MRYFTQEWYEMMVHRYVNFQVRTSAKAEVFSETYFRALYRRRLRSYLKDMRKAWEEDLAEGRETEPYDEDFFRERYEDLFRLSIEALQTELPEEILSMVADIRVLALGLGSRQVKAAVAKFCRENEKPMDVPFEAYNRQLAALQKKYAQPFIRHFGFHDWTVNIREGDPLEILLEHPNHEGTACLRFENPRILRLDEQVSGGDWLYEEIHEAEQGFELHVLCFNWNFEEPLGEMIIAFKNLIIEENELSTPTGE